MSSPKAQAAKTARKAAAPKKASKATVKTGVSADDLIDPSRAEKAAFLKALVQGIQPGSRAAEKSAARKGPAAAKAAKAPKPAAKATKPAAKTAKQEAAPRVEVLRKISGPAATPATPESQRALALAKELEAALADGKLDTLQPQAMQALMAVLAKTFSAQDENDLRYPILSGRGAVTGTDVMIVCGALLKAVDLQVFELGMWQSWSGR